MKKLFWISIAAFSGIYMFIPEPTDIIPVLGWLDEATAFTVLIYALGKLNVKIPNIFRNKKTKSVKDIITID